MKLLGIITTLALAIVVYSGCTPNVAGGTTDSPNAKVIGVFTDTIGKPMAGTSVLLIPENFNPVSDKKSLIKTSTTDNSGSFSFDSIPAGTFNIEAQNAPTNTGKFINGLSFDGTNKTNKTVKDTLVPLATVIIPIDHAADSSSATIYISGSTKSITVDKGTSTATIPAIPCGTLSTIAEKRRKRQLDSPVFKRHRDSDNALVCP
jgi:hypothetical protein